MEEKEIAFSYFPIEESQAKISTDPVAALSAIKMGMKEAKVAPIATCIIIVSENVSENLPEQSTPVNPTVYSIAKLEELARGLNPEAPAWQKKRVKEPAPCQNCVPQANPVTPPLLMNNKLHARQRLHVHPLKKCLHRDPALHKKYRNFMDDLINKGYTRKVMIHCYTVLEKSHSYISLYSD